MVMRSISWAIARRYADWTEHDHYVAHCLVGE